MKTDIQIAKESNMKNIMEIISHINLNEDEIEQYGKYKGKINLSVFERLKGRRDGKLILVTAITPTPAGEGKSTITVGLTQALNRIGKSSIATLREPSLGPVFGMKGGATGGGYSQVVPMEDINLHFTGDIHAIGTAHNLISACIDNHINSGNSLDIDITKITWKRVLDMNDRALRHIVIGMGGKGNGIPRESSFQITVASEIMAILCLSTSLSELKRRVRNIIFAYSKGGIPLTVGDLKIENAVVALLKEAIKPNIVQTLENTPVFIHGGPFANIAHGCNSLIATKLSLKLCDYTVTEAGFGADLGAEKFFDIKCRKGEIIPNCVVLVATIRALKHHGGAKELTTEDLVSLKNGIVNLNKHIENIKKFKLPVIVAINKFMSDTKSEIDLIKDYCTKINVPISLCEVWEKGGQGGEELAKIVIEEIDKNNDNFTPLYQLDLDIKSKIEKIAMEIYGASGVIFNKKSINTLEMIKKLGYDKFPVCISKTQKSFSDNPTLLGVPTEFKITINDIKISAGAEFIVAMAGEIIDMPGLPKTPAAEFITVDNNGEIEGLF